MIDPEFIIENENGLFCAAGDFYLDPKQPVPRAVISHAHGDHAVGGNDTIYCTPATAAIMRLRLNKNAGKVFEELEFEAPFRINGVSITFIPAGHILGSSQVLLEYNNIRYLYTGDYKLQADTTCEPVQIVNAHVLITESTFATPSIVHPPGKLHHAASHAAFLTFSEKPPAQNNHIIYRIRFRTEGLLPLLYMENFYDR